MEALLLSFTSGKPKKKDVSIRKAGIFDLVGYCIPRRSAVILGSNISNIDIPEETPLVAYGTYP